MALLAMLYGVLSRHGIWYPINLLSAGFFGPEMDQSTAAAHALPAGGLRHRGGGARA